jgi:molybdopterin-guanine dinucleotide biosynthesis protein A
MNSKTTHSRILGAVLCGGKSTRMGRDKASITHPLGENYLLLAINRLAAICDDVIVSGESQVKHDRVVVTDSVPHQGPVMGIVAALQYAKQHDFEGCFVTPVDTPNLSERDLKLLLDNWNQHHQLTLAQSDSLEPLIGIYTVNELDELYQLASSGDRSLARWVRNRVVQTVNLPAQACRNINTPEDLSHAS